MINYSTDCKLLPMTHYCTYCTLSYETCNITGQTVHYHYYILYSLHYKVYMMNSTGKSAHCTLHYIHLYTLNYSTDHCTLVLCRFSLLVGVMAGTLMALLMLIITSCIYCSWCPGYRGKGSREPRSK